MEENVPHTFAIEEGVPIPRRCGAGINIGISEALRELRRAPAGSSIRFDIAVTGHESAKLLAQTVSRLSSAIGSPGTFSCRTDATGVRIWRLDHKAV